MRGLPPLQALLLLIMLVVIGFAGSLYIKMGYSVSHQPPPSETTTDHLTVEAEIELIFSSPPLSYTLTQPSTSGGPDEVLLRSNGVMENPYYETATLTSHQLTTYWLDVVWPEDAKESEHHFIQINISPNHGASQRFSFFSQSKEMNETFEYSTGEHHHE